MAKKLFIGSLPYSATQAQLEELFSQVGTVESAAVIIDRESGQSKGFGVGGMEYGRGSSGSGFQVQWLYHGR